ncbi:MAG: dihydroorotase [Pseudomonadota bacterium]
MHDLLLTNCQLVNEAESKQCDILIADKRISQIGADLQHEQAKRVVDVAGKVVIPGMIDDQVHFRTPGLTHKGDIATESLAAIAGGITSFMDMPNVQPPTLTIELLEKKYSTAKQMARANFGFYMGASNDNLEVLKQVPTNLACGIKVFMGASTGNMLVDDDDVLDGIFKHAPVPIITHCEYSPLINENLKKFQQKYGDDIPLEYHPIIRSEEACYRSSYKAVELAKKHGTQLHVLHLTTARELELFEQGPIENKDITAEVCVHHIFFSEEDYAQKGNLIKCNPAIKTLKDKQGLLQGVVDDRIDIIATDHAPHTWEEKQGNYMTAPAGLPLVQHALLSALEHVHDGVFSLEKLVDKTTHNVAKRFAVAERGYVREGYFADIAIIDMDKPFEVTKENVLAKCGWSPFEGYTFRSSIDRTILNGEVVYENNAPVEAPFYGEQLKFDR